MKNKAYTLIELLVVIIILGVVATIATPIVMNSIDDARNAANMRTVDSLVQAGAYYYSESQMDKAKKINVENINDIYDSIKVKNKPDGGSLYVNKKGEVALTLTKDKKCYIKDFYTDVRTYDSNSSFCQLGFVGVDDTAPVVSFNINGTIGLNNWYTSLVEVTLDVIDNESGLKEYSWCTGINCEPSTTETVVSRKVIVDDSSRTQVCVITKDNASNVSEKQCSEKFKVDHTDPYFDTTTDIVVARNTVVDLNQNVFANDVTSGINGTYSYSPLIVDTSKAGVYPVNYVVTDNAGRTGNITRYVTVETQVPVITFTAEDKINEYGWAKEDFYVSINVADNSGLGIKEFRVCTSTTKCDPTNGSIITDSTTATRLISTESASNRICVQATDNYDQKTAVICSGNYKLDKSAPIVGTASFAGILGLNDWYTTDVTINLVDGSDALSGHLTTTVNYESITESGLKTVVVTTSDKAGNTSTHDYSIKVDKTLPTIVFNLKEIDGLNGWYKTMVPVTITASDTFSDLDLLKYCIGTDCEPDVETIESSKIVNITDTNETQVCAVAIDKAGNASTKSCTEIIKVDTIKPAFSGIGDKSIAKDSIIDLSEGVTISDETSKFSENYTYTPTSIDTSKAGVHPIKYSITDNAGNTREITRTITVATNPPDVTFTAASGVINTYGWAKSDFYVTINVTDNSGHGIKEFRVCTANSDTCNPINGSVVNGTTTSRLISTESNNNRICVEAYDNYNSTSSGIICSDAYKLDKTKPTPGTATITGTLGANGWYTSSVTLTKNDGTDPLSGHLETIININSITSNTTGTDVIVTTSDKAGNTASNHYNIKVDKTSFSAPTILATDNITSNNWHTSDFTLNLSGASSTSGINYYYGTNTNTTSSGTSAYITNNTASTTYYAKICNTAGTCSDLSSYIVKLDKVAPTINLSKLTYQEGMQDWRVSGGASISNNEATIPKGGNISTPFYTVNGQPWQIAFKAKASAASNYSSTGSGIMESSYYSNNNISVISDNSYSGNGYAPIMSSVNTWTDLTWTGWDGFGTNVKKTYFSLGADSYYTTESTTSYKDFRIYGQLYSSFYDITISKGDSTSGVNTVKYAKGEYAKSYFASSGTVVTTDSIRVYENGRYTIFVSDNAGNSSVSYIDITNIDTTAPAMDNILFGAPLYNDPTFASGMNGTSVYTWSGNVTNERVSMSTPYGSTALKIVTSAPTEPGHGGFTFGTPSALNRTFLIKIVANIPVGYRINWTTNAIGTGGYETDLTDNLGIGDWKEYVFRVNCGTGGSFSSTNYFYLTGGTAPVTWYVAYANVFDTSNYGTSNAIMFGATDTNGIVAYGINQSSTTRPTFINVPTQTRFATINDVTSNGTYYLWTKDAAGNTSIQSITVNHIDKTAPTVSYSLAEGTYNSSKNVTITPSDDLSGVSYYKIHLYKNGVKHTEYNGLTNSNYTVTIGSTGTWTIYTYVVDRAGNVITSMGGTYPPWNYKNYVIDVTNPTISYSLAEGSYNTSKNITITPSDVGTGVSYYNIHLYKNGVYQTGYNSITSSNYTVTIGSTGTWTIYTYVVDKAGNIITSMGGTYPPWNYKTYIIDLTTPTVTISRSGNTLNSSVSPSSTITGYSYQWYKNNSAISGATGSSYTVSSDGTYKLIVTTGVGLSGTSNVITRRTATLTYNGSGATGGSTTSQSCYIYTGSEYCSVSLKSNGFTKSGYDFIGFYSSAYKDHPLNYYADINTDVKSAYGYNASNLYSHYLTNGKNEGRTFYQYTEGQSVTISGDTTLYAGWVKALYAGVAANGTILGTFATGTCYISGLDTTCSITLPTITRSGYTIVGYNTSSSSTANNSSYNTSNRVLTISESNAGNTWFAISYKDVTVNYNANGATGSTISQSCRIQNSSTACSIRLNSSGFTRTNYDFLGWGIGTSSVSHNVSTTYNFSSNTTLYAIWKIRGITLTSSNVSVGQYISMTPTSTYYAVNPIVSSSDAILNPSELNLWRVIKINDNGTIEAISNYVSSEKVKFEYQSNFVRYVGSLNTIASQYTNTKYVQSTRYFGYKNQTETLLGVCTNNWCSSEAYGAGDSEYIDDWRLVSAINALKAYSVSDKTTSTPYWMASRYYYYQPEGTFNAQMYGRIIDADGYTSYNVINNSGWNIKNAIRPIVIFKAGLLATSGNGSESSPWLLP